MQYVLEISPALAVGLLAAVLALGVGLWVPFARPKARWVAVPLAVLFLLPAAWAFSLHFPEVLDGRIRAYKALYADLQPSMTRAQVFAALERHYPAAGPRPAPRIYWDEPDALGFFMDPEGRTEPNCEGIQLELKDGRVWAKRYSAD